MGVKVIRPVKAEKPGGPRKAKRNDRVVEAWNDGMSKREIAVEFNISRQRVTQILQRADQEQEEEQA